MKGDLSIQNMLRQLSGMKNVDAFLETTRQLAMQMSNENPEFIASIRQQNEGGDEGDVNASNPNPEPKDNN
jgi:hypothetical protein